MKTQWSTYTQDQQRALLAEVINKYYTGISLFVLYHEYRYELCPNTQMIHVHGVAKTTQNIIDGFQIFVHKHFGMPKLNPSIVCYIERTEWNVDYWNDYINKQTDQDGYHDKLSPSCFFPPV